MSNAASFSDLVLSFALNYWLHSTALLTCCWLASRSSQATSRALSERVWKLAAVLSVVTAGLQSCGYRNSGLNLVWSLPQDGPPVANSVVAARREGDRDQQAAAARSAALRQVEPVRIAAPVSIDPPTASRPRNSTLIAAPAILPPDQPSASVLLERDNAALEPVASASLLSRAEQLGTIRSWWQLVSTSLSVLFVASAAGTVVLLACQSWRLHRRLARAESLCSGPARRALDRFLRRNGVSRRVRLSTSSHCHEPIAYGLCRWTIVLPQGTDSRLDPEELDALLAHEVAHLVRGDVRWLWIGRLLCTCFAFQPLNFLARSRWQEAAEYLCDDWAVQRGIRPITLARCLLQIAEWRLGIPASAVGLAAGGPKKTLVHRVERLVGETQSPDIWSRPLPRGAVNIAALLSIPLLVAFAPCVGVPSAGGSPSDLSVGQRESEQAAWSAGTTTIGMWGGLEEELRQLEADLQRLDGLMTQRTKQSTPTHSQGGDPRSSESAALTGWPHTGDRLERFRSEFLRRAAQVRARRNMLSSLIEKELER